jgi:hypothetical protein
MKKTSIVIVINGCYLATNLLFNLHAVAETALATTPATVSSGVSATTPNTAADKTSANISTNQEPAKVADKEQQPSESKTIDPPEPLKKIVGDYFAAWQKHDYKAMWPLENWEGGEKLDEIKYIQSFDANFKLHSWTPTKVEVNNNNEYKVLVLISHNLPANIAALVGKDRAVNSTVVQWWKKQGDTFVHLYNLERERAMELLPKMESLIKQPNKPL